METSRLIVYERPADWLGFTPYRYTFFDESGKITRDSYVNLTPERAETLTVKETLTDAAIFIERIDEIPLLPEIGVDPDFSTDKFVAMIEKTITAARAANRQNDCPFQIQDGDEWFCGKITDARVVCPDMADFKACGGYPYKKFKDFCEELNRKATKIIEQYRGDK